MVIRENPKCFICGKDIARAIHDTESNIIGDNFLRWEYFDHECDEEKIKRMKEKMSQYGEVVKSLNNKEYDVEHETKMVQSRILAPLIEVIEQKGYTVQKLSELTGLNSIKITALLNIENLITMEQIALFQKALGIVIQPPEAITTEEHNKKFYVDDTKTIKPPKERIRDVYDSLVKKYSDIKSNRDTRVEIKTKLQIKLGSKFIVILDETNNPPELVDMDCIVAQIRYNNCGHSGFDYVYLVFGNNENVDILLNLYNLK
jgi:hypothetical protein